MTTKTTTSPTQPTTAAAADTATGSLGLHPAKYTLTVQSPTPLRRNINEELLPHLFNPLPHSTKPATTTNSTTNTAITTQPSMGHTTMLQIPEPESLIRPATPRADLYPGQQETCFGMTFEQPDKLSMRKPKPSQNAFNYEDQKHCMMMAWLERRGTW